MRTRIFFSVNNTDYLLVPNFRIIEFQSHGISRTVTDFLFCHEFSFFLSRIIELSNFVFTRNITDCHGFSFSFLVPNYRIFEFFSSHGISRTVTDFLFLFLSRIIELSNFNHTEYRGQSRIFFFSFLVPRLVLGPTDQREVIIELSNFVFTRNIADSHGFLSSFFSCPEFSRLVLGPTDQREVIFEFLSSHG